MKTTKIGLVWIGLLIVMAFVILLFVRCSHTKDIVKTENRQEDSRVKELSDSLHLVITERDKLESEIKELQYAGVVFVTDTLTSHDTITNTVEITTDGGIKAKGNISSAYVSKSFVSKIISKKEKIIDSLKSVKEKEKIITKTITVTKNKHIKTSFLNFWWLLAIGYCLGRWGKQIFNYAKNKIYG